ncbi:MAG: hypothetical protein PHE15_00280 [Dehalococcoidales bacterium]|nr:hypothetical protein [Dehalococcoidales bacterium]
MCWNEFKQNPYKWLWSRIGGRPWTYILRDIWHKYELVWIAVIFTGGVLLGHYCGFKTVLTIGLSFLIGYLFGHLFWGSEYIENQQGD